MITKYRAKAFVWGIPGILLQMLGGLGIFAQRPATADMNPQFAAVFFIIMGTALLMFGLVWYCRAKDRHPAWALTGLLSLPGCVVLYFLNDKTVQKKKKR